MRWKKPHTYDQRTIRRFLLFPTKIDHETRWLEYADIQQEYNGVYWDNYVWINRKDGV